MSSPAISIITPSLNQGAFIDACVQSVLSQDVPGIEYVVVDGRSSDHTLEFLHYRLQAAPGAFLLISEPDEGHADAINKGILRSHGEIIGWLNSDDVYVPGALKTVTSYFETHQDVDVLYGDAFFIDEGGSRIGIYPTAPWDPDLLRDRCIISQPSAFVRRRVLERHGLLDNTYRTNDYELWIRLALAGVNFVYLPEYLSATRLHDRSATVTLSVRCHEDAAAIQMRHYGRVSSTCLSRLARAQARRTCNSGVPRASYLRAKAQHLKSSSRRWNRSICLPDLLKACYWQALGLLDAAGIPTPLTKEERETLSGPPSISDRLRTFGPPTADR